MDPDKKGILRRIRPRVMPTDRMPGATLPCGNRTCELTLAFGVAEKGADDALTPAKLVALAQCEVLRLSQARGGGPAVRAAEVLGIDREGGATPQRGQH